MTNFWPLTFALIGYWVLAGALELIRTPSQPRSGTNRLPDRPVT